MIWTFIWRHFTSYEVISGCYGPCLVLRRTKKLSIVTTLLYRSMSCLVSQNALRVVSACSLWLVIRNPAISIAILEWQVEGLNIPPTPPPYHQRVNYSHVKGRSYVLYSKLTTLTCIFLVMLRPTFILPLSLLDAGRVTLKISSKSLFYDENPYSRNKCSDCNMALQNTLRKWYTNNSNNGP